MVKIQGYYDLVVNFIGPVPPQFEFIYPIIVVVFSILFIWTFCSVSIFLGRVIKE